MSSDTMKAIIVDKDSEDKISASLQNVSTSMLDTEGEVLIKTAYSGLNYKDGLCLNGGGGLIREFPRIAGIEMSGTVISSSDSRYAEGDHVLITGWRFGETHHGGFAEMVRAKADWLVKLPEGMSLRQAMILGTPGLSAMLALEALEAHGLTPGGLPVLVTGAAGGVGSVAVALLASAGYDVAAVTGRIDEAGPYLTALGASQLVPRDELNEAIARPLEKELWAGCIDNVGGEMLARILGQLCYGGAVAAIGNAGGIKVPANVIPFLLRGVNLLGIDSVHQPYERRAKSWARLASDFPMDKLDAIVQDVSLDEIPALSSDILKGQVKGRVIAAL